uniref:Uncharacterized protein n=1 Tax=Amphimedon queenslandica TaxID=400682 RepID=A0A1X7ULG1_AMPQE
SVFSLPCTCTFKYMCIFKLKVCFKTSYQVELLGYFEKQTRVKCQFNEILYFKLTFHTYIYM